MRGAARCGKLNAPFGRQVSCTGIQDSSGAGSRLYLTTPTKNDSNVMNESNVMNDLHYQQWTITKGYAQITEAWG